MWTPCLGDKLAVPNFGTPVRAMCGRYTQLRPWSELVALYRITADAPPPNLPPRYNIAPTQSVPIVRQGNEPDGRELALVRWGLLPAWAKDIRTSYTMINARAETVDQKPSFRQAFRKRSRVCRAAIAKAPTSRPASLASPRECSLDPARRSHRR